MSAAVYFDLLSDTLAQASHGGHIVSFISVLPTIGLGALQPMTTAEESSAYDTPKEKALYAPRRIEWSNLADQLAEAGIGVSIFMAPSNIIDVASIGIIWQVLLYMRSPNHSRCYCDRHGRGDVLLSHV